MSLIQLVLAILGIVLVIFGVVDLVHSQLVWGAILTIVGLIVLVFAKGGANLRI